ncbi:MAG: signal peptidase I [bacterium]|nr:signal peptidase I [bacterium]
MKKGSSIDDSLEFCKEIKYYEEKDDPLAFDEKNFPKLKEYIQWINDTDQAVHSDYVAYESALRKIEQETPTQKPIKKQAEIIDFPMEEMDEEEEEKTTLLGVIGQILACLLVAIVLVYGITTFVVTYSRVNGGSMEITLHDGNVVAINRFTYRFHDPEQFDVIVFKNDTDINLVKRIIALPGQTIQIVDGKIYVDGEVINENYGTEDMSYAGNAAEPITLGVDEYFVLGDNRNNSTDSRSSYVGLVRKKDIIGKVSARLYPFSQFGGIE